MTAPLADHARPAAAAIAGCAWAGLALQTGMIIASSHSALAVALRLSRYFTIIGNLAVALVFTGIALGSIRCAAPRLIGMVLLSIVLIGAVYNLLLAGLLHPRGPGRAATMLLHDVTPVLVPAYWLGMVRKGAFTRRDPWIWAAFPTLYLGYALIRGGVGGRYSYPFMDVAALGWPAVLLNVALIGLAFVIAGHVLVALDAWLARRLESSP